MINKLNSHTSRFDFVNLYLIVLAGILVIIPWAEYSKPPYSFLSKFLQPKVWHAFPEMLLLFLGIAFLLMHEKRKNHHIVIVAVMLLFFLRIHNLDIGILIIVSYLEAIFFLGAIIYSKPLDRITIHHYFISGICLWFIFSFSLSVPTLKILGFDTAWLTIAFLFTLSLFSKEKSLLKKCITQARGVHTEHPYLFSFLIVIILYQLTKIVANPEYDELWYSLQGNKVLVKNGSFLEKNYLANNWVHVYPKLYEVFLYPIQFYQGPFISRNSGTFVSLLLSVAIYDFSRQKLPQRESLLLIIAVLCIPVVFGCSHSSKPDIFCAYVFFIANLYWLKFMETPKLKLLLWAFCTSTLCLAIKLTIFPYLAIFYFFLIISAIKRYKNIERSFSKTTMVYITITLATTLLVTLRTFLITGVPFVAIGDTSTLISNVYAFFDFQYHYPYAPIAWDQTSSAYSFLDLIILVILNPNKTGLGALWFSNLIVPLVIFFTLSKSYKKEYLETLIYLICLMLMSIIIVGYIFNGKNINGGDGNYHLTGMIIIYTILLRSILQQESYRLKTIRIILVSYTCFHLCLGMVFDMSWSSGTKEIDFKIDRSPWVNETKHNLIKFGGFDDIYDQLHQKEPHLSSIRILGEGDERLLFNLPVTFESARFFNDQISKNNDTFRKYLTLAKVTHLIVPKFLPSTAFGHLCRYTLKLKGTKTFYGKLYTLIDIRESNWATFLSTDNNAITKTNLKSHSTNGDVKINTLSKVLNRKYYRPHAYRVVAMECELEIKPIRQGSFENFSFSLQQDHWLSRSSSHVNVAYELVNDENKVIFASKHILKNSFEQIDVEIPITMENPYTLSLKLKFKNSNGHQSQILIIDPRMTHAIKNNI